MTVNELYRHLEDELPRSLSCAWDNDGLLLLSDARREVRRVLCVLDVNAESVTRAVEGSYDLIVSHHPLFFSLTSLTPNDRTGEGILRLLKAGVSVISFHTRLDAAEGGVNDLLAETFGLSSVESFGPVEEAMGRIGSLPAAVTAEELAQKVKVVLSAEGVRFADGGRPICRLALLGGEGKEYLPYAIAAGADAYLTGGIGYHKMDEGRSAGVTVIEAGHFETEAPVTAVLKEKILTHLPDAEVDVFTYNPIKSL